MRPARPNHSDTVDLRLQDRDVPIRLRRSDRARRIVLRVAPRSGEFELVIPRFVSLGTALRFAATQTDWIERRLNRLPQRLAFAHGAIIPLLGEPHVLRHEPGHRGGIERVLGEDGGAALQIGGGAEHLPRRLRDFLRREARRIVAPLAHDKAARIGRRIRRLSIRDSRTRWGSCSSTGTLSFSWRLVLTPPPVVDYLAAHEVAHLAEMNHRARFWALCRELTDADMDAARAWLRAHADSVLAIGG